LRPTAALALCFFCVLGVGAFAQGPVRAPLEQLVAPIVQALTSIVVSLGALALIAIWARIEPPATRFAAGGASEPYAELEDTRAAQERGALLVTDWM
jgi:hypothetical protein